MTTIDCELAVCLGPSFGRRGDDAAFGKDDEALLRKTGETVPDKKTVRRPALITE